MDPNSPTSDLWSQYENRRQGQHARDFAAEMGVSEAELLVSGLGRGITRLRPVWQEIFEELPGLGLVKTLTRNEHLVLEQWGSYGAEEGGSVAPIDMRLFFRQWGSAFAVEEPGKQGTRSSVQFFDQRGDSVHKVYLEDATKLEAFRALVQKYGGEPAALEIQPAAPKRPRKEGNAELLRAGWDALKDTHDFMMLLQRLELDRVQALELAGEQRALPVAQDSLARLLTRLGELRMPFMFFVGNRGCFQIFTGVIEKTKQLGAWFNVLDPGFNLHARESGIASSFVVRKPTSEGIVSSLELYDEQGETLGLIYGKRKLGNPESADWRALLAEFESA